MYAQRFEWVSTRYALYLFKVPGVQQKVLAPQTQNSGAPSIHQHTVTLYEKFKTAPKPSYTNNYKSLIALACMFPTLTFGYILDTSSFEPSTLGLDLVYP